MSRNGRNNGTAVLAGILAAIIAGFVMTFTGSLFFGIIAFFAVVLFIESFE